MNLSSCIYYIFHFPAVRPIDFPSETGQSTTTASVQSSHTVSSSDLPEELSPATEEQSFHDDVRFVSSY